MNLRTLFLRVPRRGVARHATVHALAAIVTLAGGPVWAADSGGNYAIWPLGASSCHRYGTTAADAAKRQPYRDFLTGYLTAYNTLADDTYNALGDMKLSDAMAWLDDYCDLHKLDGFERAIQQLVTARHDARRRGMDGQHSWGRVPPPAATAPAEVGFGAAAGAAKR